MPPSKSDMYMNLYVSTYMCSLEGQLVPLQDHFSSTNSHRTFLFLFLAPKKSLETPKSAKSRARNSECSALTRKSLQSLESETQREREIERGRDANAWVCSFYWSGLPGGAGGVKMRPVCTESREGEQQTVWRRRVNWSLTWVKPSTSGQAVKINAAGQM